MTQEQQKIASEWMGKFNEFVSKNYPAFEGEFEKKIIFSPSVGDPLILHPAFDGLTVVNELIRSQMGYVFEEFVKQAHA